MTVNSLEALDRLHWVHPVANWAGHEKRGVTIMKSAKGAFITDSEGHELIDGFAGLWCVNVGYGHESIVEAAAAQMRELPYATGYFSFGSEPAIRLAAKLAELLPGDLNHIYFSLGGSDAIDGALRLIQFYYNVTGRPTKKAILSLERGYHGSSSTGAGVTALPAFHANFDFPAHVRHYVAAPYAYRNPTGSDDAAVIAASVASLRAKVAELGAENVAAFFCEPVVGSGGVIVPPKGWLKAMRDTAAELDILFLADEVITGFGRTGPMFACEAEGVVPDLMTMAKGLTSGYAPLGALAIGEKIYRGIKDNAPRAARSAMARPIPAIRFRPRSRSKCSGSMTRAASWPMASASAPISRRSSRPWPIIRWSARSGRAGCSPASSSSPTRSARRSCRAASSFPTISSPAAMRTA